MTNLAKLIAATGIAASAAMPAAAQTYTSYTNKAAFTAAAGATQTETFAGKATGGFASTYSVPFDAFTLSGVTNGNKVGIYTGSVSGSDNTTIPVAFSGQNFLGWGEGTTGNTIGPITVTFAAPVTAFGFDWFNTDVSDQYQVTLPSGQIFSGPPFTTASSSAASGFFGITSTAALSSFTISVKSYGGYISTEGLDNLVSSASVTAAVPEAATWAMMMVGMGLVGGSLRRRRTVDARVRFA